MELKLLLSISVDIPDRFILQERIHYFKFQSVLVIASSKCFHKLVHCYLMFAVSLEI